MPSDLGRAGGWCPEWDAPPSVRAWMSTRQGGVSTAPFDTLNLARGSTSGADRAECVVENRRRFAAALGAEPVYLNQVHGSAVVRIGRRDLEAGAPLHRADASITDVPGVGCVVLAADCLPVLFCTPHGRAVGAAHAGWRGLAAGVLQATVQQLCELSGSRPEDISAWLGPCIGSRRFEVGADVLTALAPLSDGESSDPAFRPCIRRDGSPGWLADLPLLARTALQSVGLRRIQGGSWCTVDEPLRFFSFRRDGLTGRHAAAIAIGR